MISVVPHKRTRIAGKIDSGIIEAGPLNISNLYAWWPIDKQTGYADAGLMSLLTDYSGNYRHAFALGSGRPTYKVNIVNGLPIARFAGNHYFDAGEINLNLATWFVVWSRTNAANNDMVLCYTAGNDYPYWQNGSEWYYVAYGHTTVAMAAGSFKLKCGKYDNSNITLYTNGTQDASPASSGDCNFRYIGAGGFALNGDIAEVILFSTNLSDTDRQYIENYINTKYALW